MKGSPALLALSLLGGCAGAPPPQPIAVASVTLPAAAEPPPELVEARSPDPVSPPPTRSTEPPTFALPSPAACELSTARWRSRTATELRFRPNGPVFAHVALGRARLVFPIGPAALGAGLEISQDGLTLRGQIDGSAMELHPARRLVLDEVAVPHASQRLEWAGAAMGRVTVGLSSITGALLSRPPLSASVPCDALTLDHASFDTSPSALGAKGNRRAVLRVGAQVKLSSTPGGPVAAELTARDDDDGEVSVSEVSGSRSRIFWDRREAVLFGWVESADLHAPTHPPLGYGTGSGGGVGFGRSVHPIDRVACDKDVPVIAQAGGEQMIVGSIAAGTTIDRMSRGGDMVEVWVRTGGVQIPSAARLVVRAALLEGCEPRAP